MARVLAIVVDEVHRVLSCKPLDDAVMGNTLKFYAVETESESVTLCVTTVQPLVSGTDLRVTLFHAQPDAIGHPTALRPSGSNANLNGMDADMKAIGGARDDAARTPDTPGVGVCTWTGTVLPAEVPASEPAVCVMSMGGVVCTMRSKRRDTAVDIALRAQRPVTRVCLSVRPHP